MGAFAVGGHWIMQGAYLLGMLGVAHGGYQISHGDTPAGKRSIYGGAVMGAAPWLMNTMYAAGGLTGMQISLVALVETFVATIMGVL